MDTGLGIMNSPQTYPGKRQILSAATFRFASPLQGLRESALDQLITKVLFDIGQGECTDVNTIGEAYHAATHGGHLDPEGVVQVISRLEEKRHVEECDREGGKFRLTEEARNTLQAEECRLDQEVNDLLCRLYNCTSETARRYEKPFVAVISLVAGSIGEESANQLINGRTDSIASAELIARTVEQVTAGFRRFNVREFTQGVIDFFRSTDPACHRVLWQLAESYFVTRLIGIDPSGKSLSREIFDETEFVLDTNTILALTMKSDENHGLVSAVLRTAREIGIPIIVGDITLEEFHGVLTRQREDLKKIVERGEARWLGRLDSTVLREYDASGGTDPDRFIDRFSDIEDRLRKDWSAQITEMYPDELTHDVEKLAHQLRERYRQAKVSQRTKSMNVALHDAKLITHIVGKRESTGSKMWLLTLDNSLPGFAPEGSEWSSLAIAPRTAFQWLTPVVARSSNDGRFATVFAEMVQAHFLPRTQFFNTADFCMLLDVDENINEIPDEDVESILMRLKSRAMSLDTNRAEDREKLTAIVSATLADKNARVQRRQRELEEDRDRQLQQAVAEKQDAERNWQELLAASKQKSERELETEREARTQAENGRLRTEGYIRFWAAIIASLVIGTVLAWAIVPVLGSAFDGWSSTWVWPTVTLVSWGSITILMKQLALRRIVGENRVLVMPRPYQTLMGD